LLKFFTAFFLTIFMLFNVAPAAYAVEESSQDLQITGEGAYLIDVLSGQTLYMKNPDKQLAPASTTKIMTGLLAIEHGNLNDIVTPSSSLLNNKLVYGTQIYLVPGEKMPLKDLLYALLLNSANDAAVVIAEHVGGDLPTFVEMMNQRAREIGATNTHFVNPSGLTETGQITTARDLALISLVAYRNPTFAEYVRTKTQPISRSKPDIPTLMVNENKLLWRDTAVDGIKPGYTAAAQNCLVASVTKDGRQFIGVILKSPGKEIYTDMQAMFEFAFTQFKTTIFKPSGSIIATLMVNNEPVNLITDRPIYMAQKIDKQNSPLSLRVKPTSSSPLSEVKEGQVVAQVQVLDGNTLLGTLPLKSTRTVATPTLTSGFRSNYLSWTTGFMLVITVLALLISRKILADRRWRREMRQMRRKYPFSESRD